MSRGLIFTVVHYVLFFSHLGKRATHCKIIVTCNKSIDIIHLAMQTRKVDLFCLKSKTRLTNNFGENFTWIYFRR